MSEAKPDQPILPGLETEPETGENEAPTTTHIDLGDISQFKDEKGKTVNKTKKNKSQDTSANVPQVQAPITPETRELLKKIRKRPMRERADIGPLHNTISDADQSGEKNNV